MSRLYEICLERVVRRGWREEEEGVVPNTRPITTGLLLLIHSLKGQFHETKMIFWFYWGGGGGGVVSTYLLLLLLTGKVS
jgi:hypothetical protein